MLSAETAARLIGYVELRTWLRWENGVSKVPDYVIKSMIEINHDRQNHISSILNSEKLDLEGFTIWGSDLLIIPEIEKLLKKSPQLALKPESIAAGVYAYLLDEYEWADNP